MNFGKLSIGDKLFVLHSDSALEEKRIKTISSHNGFISMSFIDTPLTVKVDSNKSIYFDEAPDVILFTEKHNLYSDIIEK